MVFRILFIIIAVWLLFTILALAAAFFSGKVKRAYAVLPPEQVVQIHGVDRPVSAWAAEYQPVMLLRSKTFSPPLLNVFYEAIEGAQAASNFAATTGKITFVYYHVWEDEIHPNALYHRLYKTFRAAYYGYPVRDIEFFQVVVDRETGEVTSLLFETTPGKDYYVTLSEHVVQRITRKPSGSFSETHSDRKGKMLSSQDSIPVRFEDHHVVVGVATWNHLTQLVSLADTDFDTRLSAPLAFLTDADYQNYKFVRKSQGDFKTHEPPIDLLLGGLSALLVGGPIYLVMRFIQSLRQKRSYSNHLAE